MKKKIKIGFSDFWGDFNPENNFITNTLRNKYDIEITGAPDYLFFSAFGYDHLKYNCVKTMFIGENIVPDFNMCDYALGFDHIQFGDRYMRLPLYCLYACFPSVCKRTEIIDEKVLDRKFCSIVVSNQRFASSHRERFFKLLSEYKQVDSGGMLWNNIGGAVADKLEFVSQYKFNIAFENSSVHGYTTEKIMEPMAVNTLPIYWGNPLVCKDFNAASFVNVNDFASMEDAVQYIVDLDNDDSKYLQMIKAPKVLDENIINWEERLLDFLSNIIEKPVEEAKYLTPFGIQKIYREEMLAYDILSRRLKVKKIVAAYDKLRKKIRG